MHQHRASKRGGAVGATTTTALHLVNCARVVAETDTRPATTPRPIFHNNVSRLLQDVEIKLFLFPSFNFTQNVLQSLNTAAHLTSRYSTTHEVDDASFLPVTIFSLSKYDAYTRDTSQYLRMK